MPSNQLIPSHPIRLTAAVGLSGCLAIPFAAAGQERLIERLQAGDPAAGDLFGCALDLRLVPEGADARGLLLVGSLNDDDRGADSGSAYVYELLPGETGWTETAKLLASEGAAGDRTGFSVALAPLGAGGDRALLGSPGSGTGGAVHRFERTPDGDWLATGRLSAAVGAGAGLGSAVLFDGDDVLAGAPTATAGGVGRAGAVVRFGSNGGEIRRYTAAEPQAEAGFGWAIAAQAGDGPRVAIGAPWEDTPFTDSGGVYVLAESGFLLERLVSPDRGVFDAFGYSVAIEGDLLAVGAPRAAAGAGVVYVFRQGPLAYQLDARFTGAPGDQLGTEVVLSGGVLAAGARGEEGSRGAVRFYRRIDAPGEGACAWSETRRVQTAGSRAGDEVGIALALSGGSFALGAYRDDGGGADAGAAFAEVVEIAGPVVEPPPPPPSSPKPLPPRPDLPPALSATLGVTGDTIAGRVITYTLTVANAGTGPLRDAAGDEVVMPIPVQLVALTGRATSGSVRLDPPIGPPPGSASNPPGGWAAWNGSVPAGDFVTIEIDAMIVPGTQGSVVAAQAVVKGPDGEDVRSASPGATEAGPTLFAILSLVEVPALSARSLALLALLLAASALGFLRR